MVARDSLAGIQIVNLLVRGVIGIGYDEPCTNLPAAQRMLPSTHVWILIVFRRSVHGLNQLSA
jgi:hypothetical protein